MNYYLTLNMGNEAFGTEPTITANEQPETMTSAQLAREMHQQKDGNYSNIRVAMPNKILDSEDYCGADEAGWIYPVLHNCYTKNGFRLTTRYLTSGNHFFIVSKDDAKIQLFFKTTKKTWKFTIFRHSTPTKDAPPSPTPATMPVPTSDHFIF